MGLTNAACEAMVTTFSEYCDKLYLATDTGDNVALDDTIGDVKALSPTVELIDDDKALTWGSAVGTSPGAGIVTSNSATSNPINFSVPEDKAIKRMYVTDDNATENSRIVYGIIDIPTPLPSYSAGDGAYFVRKLTLLLTEV